MKWAFLFFLVVTIGQGSRAFAKDAIDEIEFIRSEVRKKHAVVESSTDEKIRFLSCIESISEWLERSSVLEKRFMVGQASPTDPAPIITMADHLAIDFPGSIDVEVEKIQTEASVLLKSIRTGFSAHELNERLVRLSKRVNGLDELIDFLQSYHGFGKSAYSRNKCGRFLGDGLVRKLDQLQARINAHKNHLSNSRKILNKTYKLAKVSAHYARRTEI